MRAPLILFNPSAGMGRARRGKERLDFLLRNAGLAWEFVVTLSEAHLKDLARRAARGGRTVVGAGGDSTFHIIVNEIMSEGGRSLFGMLGLGSSNDIPLALGLAPLERAVAALKAGRTKRIDLGAILQGRRVLRYFVGQANIGLGAAVNRYVERLARRRPWLARFQKAAGVLGVAQSFRKRLIPIPLTISSGKELFAGEFTAAVFANTRLWATGKPIAPSARPDDGRLDVCLIGKCSFRRLVRISALADKGLHVRAPEVRLLQGREFLVRSVTPFDIQADGEVIPALRSRSAKDAVRFRVLPSALKIIAV